MPHSTPAFKQSAITKSSGDPLLCGAVHPPGHCGRFGPILPPGVLCPPMPGKTASIYLGFLFKRSSKQAKK